MRHPLIVILFLACFLGASASSFGQDAAKANLEAQVQALEAELAELRAQVEEAEERMDQTVEYLQRGQKSAAEMARVLAASEEAGFTFGINPKSRELLLEGWRKQLSELQKGVPGAAPAPQPGTPVVRGTRR